MPILGGGCLYWGGGGGCLVSTTVKKYQTTQVFYKYVDFLCSGNGWGEGNWTSQENRLGLAGSY